MILRYNLTHDDYILFNLFHHQHDPAMRRVNLLLRLLFPALLFGFLVIFRPRPIRLYSAMLLVASLLWLVAFPRMHRRNVRKIVNRQFPKDAPHEFTGLHCIHFLEDRIRCERVGRSSETDYANVVRIAQTEQALYIYDTRLSAFIIPLTGAERPEHAEQLLSLLQEKTNLPIQVYR